MKTLNMSRVSLVAGFLVVVVGFGCGGGLKPHSNYTIESRFDVQTSFSDSSLGEVLNILNEMSDHADDPGRYVIEMTIDALPSSISWTLSPFIGSLGREFNEVLNADTPSAAATLKSIASGISDAARQFELTSHLVVEQDGDGLLVAQHMLTDATYHFEGNSYTVDAEEFADRAEPATGIAVQIDNGTLTIAEHQMGLPVGTLLDKIVGPLIIAGTTPSEAPVYNFFDLFVRTFGCSSIYQALVTRNPGLVDAFTFSACTEGIEIVSNRIRERILELDNESALTLRGTATEIGSSVYEGSGWNGSYTLGGDITAPLDPPRCPFNANRETTASP